jgi:hypothetical protein
MSRSWYIGPLDEAVRNRLFRQGAASYPLMERSAIRVAPLRPSGHAYVAGFLDTVQALLPQFDQHTNN